MAYDNPFETERKKDTLSRVMFQRLIQHIKILIWKLIIPQFMTFNSLHLPKSSLAVILEKQCVTYIAPSTVLMSK